MDTSDVARAVSLGILTGWAVAEVIYAFAMNFGLGVLVAMLLVGKGQAAWRELGSI